MFCSIERTLSVVGERWTFLILRETLLNGLTKFADFEKILGIAPNVLADRLATLVSAGVLEKREYKEEGSRPRFSYHPTPKGEELKLVLAALQQWGDNNIPPDCGVTMVRQTVEGDRPVRVGFIDDADQPRSLEEVKILPTESYPFEARAARLAGASV